MATDQAKNGVTNGSFLVLNLGTNTLQLGNSVNPTAQDKPHEEADIISSSTEEISSPSSKRIEADPDWVPEKRPRRSNKPASPDPDPVVVSPSSSVSAILNNNSRAGPPPQYLIGLLRFFGWKVVFRAGHKDYVYVSPAGLTYCSFPKAFETFLHGTSKYKDKGSILSQFSMSSAFAGSSAERTSPTTPGDNNLASGSGKKPRGRKRRNAIATVAENDKPILAIKDTVSPREESLVGNQKVGEKRKSVVENSSLGVDLPKDGKLSGVRRRRRSTRISGRGVTVENEVNVVSEVGRGKKKDMEQVPTASRAEVVEVVNDEAIDEGLNNEAGKSYCSNVGVANNVESGTCLMDRESRWAGLRRSGRLNKKIDEVSVEHKGNESETSYLAKKKSVGSKDVRKDEGKTLPNDKMPHRTLALECVSNDKLKHRMDGENLHGNAKRLTCSSTMSLSHPNVPDLYRYRDATEIRRSTRINGKHVPVDDDSDVEFESESVSESDDDDDDYLDSSEFSANTEAMKDREKLMASFLKVGIEGRRSTSDEMQLKQKDLNKFDTQKINIDKFSEGSESLESIHSKSMCEKSSASLKESGLGFSAFSDKCSSSSAVKRKPSGFGNSNEKKKHKRRGGCGLTVRRKLKENRQEEIVSQKKINILSWLIDCGTLTENEKVFYIAKNNMGNTSSGVVTRGGIWCNCCKEVVPLLKFIAHAHGNPQQPWDNIFLLSGKTLLFCLKEAWEKEKKEKQVGFQTVGIGDPDPSDDTCGVCADGGHLICCDSCPSTFHQNCLMLKALPEGSWHCPYCRCSFCMATAEIQQTKTLLSCKQCGKKYHPECAWGNDIDLMGPVPFSFCGNNCKEVAVQLSSMLGIANPIEGGFSWSVLKRFDKDEGVSGNQRLCFIMESNVKLSMALSVLDECFVPLLDQRTGVNMLSQAVYNCGSNFKRLNYEGFYTLVLEKDEEIISAASLRLHGRSLAEMPFIGTRPMYRKQGMCRRLLKAVEDMLSSLHVEKLIIPAISDLLETWKTSFSFKPMEPSHKDEIRNLSMMIFAETTLLQKPICSTTTLAQEDVMPATNGGNHVKRKETDELPRAFADQMYREHQSACSRGSWINECNLEGQKGVTAEPSKMSNGFTFSPDSLSASPPNISNGSISEASLAQSTFTTNLSTTPRSFTVKPFSIPSINVVLDSDPLGAETTPSPDSQMNMWFRNADGMKDLQIDAISSSLSFESFIRIRG